MYKYATQAGVSAAAWHWIIGRKGSGVVLPGGMFINNAILGAGLGIVSALSTDVLHDTVLNYMSKDDRLRHVEGAVLAPSMAAGSAFVASKVLHPTLSADVGHIELLGIAAASELVGQWVYENMVVPYVTADFKEVSAF